MPRCPAFRFADLAALQELTRFWLDDPVPGPVTAFGGPDARKGRACRLPVAVLAGPKLCDITWPLGCVPVSLHDARTLRDRARRHPGSPGLLARTR